MVKRYAVGSVPYLNAKPLIKPLLWDGENSRVRVQLEAPSRLPEMLVDGSVQAILVSSISALVDPTSTVAAGLSISTQREVLSVRLFSKVPFDQIETLAEDQSSMTSNALAKIILRERFGVFPDSISMPPDGSSMLATCDACILIGDNGMRFEGSGLHVLDLGREWYQLTELPFVWAVWKGNENLSPELVGYLQDSLSCSFEQLPRVIVEASEETGFTVDQCSHYIQKIMDYRLEDAHLKGLSLFGDLLKKHGLLADYFIPKVIQPTPAPVLR